LFLLHCESEWIHNYFEPGKRTQQCATQAAR
jgi:hypothetical protein